MSTERKLDIFRVLKQADLKDEKFYDLLTTEEKKAFQPFLVARWLSGTSSEGQVVFLNEVVNPYLFTTHIQRDHRGLLWRLMTIVTTGKPKRYLWNKLPGKATSSQPTSLKVVMESYKLSAREAEDALRCLSGNDVLDLAEALGLQAEDLSKIRKEFKGEHLRDDGIGSGRGKQKHQPEADFFGF